MGYPTIAKGKADEMKRQKTPAATSSIRVIGGQWRGRKLPVVDLPGLRPTADRVRETLFNWLQLDIAGRSCLDAFAGTGALGIEALSRGASHLVALEMAAPACRQLESNFKLLQAGAELHCGNSLDWLDRPATEQFDLVFLDPPFDADLWQPTLELLTQRDWLRPDCLIYLERPASLPQPPLKGFALRCEKKISRVGCYLFERQPA